MSASVAAAAAVSRSAHWLYGKSWVGGSGAPEASGTLGFLAVGRVIASGGRRAAVNSEWCGFSGCLVHPTHGNLR